MISPALANWGMSGFPLFRIRAVLTLTFRAKFGALSGAQLVIAKGFDGG